MFNADLTIGSSYYSGEDTTDPDLRWALFETLTGRRVFYLKKQISFDLVKLFMSFRINRVEESSIYREYSQISNVLSRDEHCLYICSVIERFVFNRIPAVTNQIPIPFIFLKDLQDLVKLKCL